MFFKNQFFQSKIKYAGYFSFIILITALFYYIGKQTNNFYILGIFIPCISILLLCVGYQKHLQKLVHKQATLLNEQSEELVQLQQSVIIAMAHIVESRDGGTGTHIKRSSAFVNILANELLKQNLYTNILNEHSVKLLSLVAPMHDIGKVHIPDAILTKPASLTEEEIEIMKSHSKIGGELIYQTMNGINNPLMVQMAYDVATYHHERWDGSGYPKGLSGNDIPVAARIMAIADVFEALTARRPYKPAFSTEEAFRLIEEGSGTHFDPEMTAVFLSLKPQLQLLLEQLNKMPKLNQPFFAPTKK